MNRREYRGFDFVKFAEFNGFGEAKIRPKTHRQFE